MPSQSGIIGTDDGQPGSSLEKPPGDEYPLAHIDSRYKDEDLERAGDGRGSTDHGDLELGSVPLLASNSAHVHTRRDSDDSDGSDYDFARRDVRRDPSFSCKPTGFCAWLRGPTPPQIYHIKPWFPQLQSAPSRLFGRLRRSVKIALLFAGLLFWVAVFFYSLKSSVQGQEVMGYGQPVRLSCHHRLWYVGALSRSLECVIFVFLGLRNVR